MLNLFAPSAIFLEYIEPGLNVRKSFKQQESEARELIAIGAAANNDEVYDVGLRRMNGLTRVRDELAEHRGPSGSVPVIAGNETAVVIALKRKYSAVQVDELAMLPTVRPEKLVAPNVVLRSSLFAVIKKGNRRDEVGMLVTSESNVVVTFSGKRLDQGDLDVWLHCLSLSRDGLDKAVTVRLAEFLNEIGRSHGKQSYQWLRDSLERLSLAVVGIQKKGEGGYSIQAPLLNLSGAANGGQEVTISIPSAWALTCGVGQWTALVRKKRWSVVGKPLAQWLSGFYSTHAQPIPLKLSKLMAQCASESSSKEFRRSLQNALEVCVANKVITAFKFTTNGCVAVFRK